MEITLQLIFQFFGEDSIPITAMFIGKDDYGRYNFADKGLFTLSKEFIERGKVSIDKEFNGDEIKILPSCTAFSHSPSSKLSLWNFTRKKEKFIKKTKSKQK